MSHITDATDDEGNKYDLENGRTPVRVKPVIVKHAAHYTISVRDEKEARHIIKKLKVKEPSLETDNLDQKLKQGKTKKRLQKPLNITIELGGDEAFRTIAKIAVNTYLLGGGDRKYTGNVVDYIRSGNHDPPKIVHWHVEEGTMTLDPLEVCHCIYINGNSKSKLLYVYVELFNLQSAIVKLSESYEGVDFERTYCLDVLNGKQVEKLVTVKYPAGASPEGYRAYDPVFFPVMQARMDRLKW